MRQAEFVKDNSDHANLDKCNQKGKYKDKYQQVFG